MQPLHIKTPLIKSRGLSDRAKTDVLIKIESLQPTGSFKIRGIGRLCQHYATTFAARRFVSSSGGNAGLAVAYAGRQLGVPVTVVIPKSTLPHMVDKIQSEGAEVVVHGEDWNAADALARQMADEEWSFYIPPFDHPLIWEGHSSIVEEIEREDVRPDAVFVAVGGGGLFCGIAEGIKKAGWDQTQVYTIETKGAASFAKSYELGKCVTLDRIETIATSLGARKVAEKALELAFTLPVTPLTVTDEEAVEAAQAIASMHRILVEPACGAAVSPVYHSKVDLSQYKKVVIILCGGVVI